jgi:hypothetical protein
MPQPGYDWYQQALDGAIPFLLERWAAEREGDRRREHAAMRNLHRFYRSIGAPYSPTYAGVEV